MGVRAVDLGILVLCTAAVLLSLQQEGDLVLSPSWSYEIDPSTFANGHAPDISERLPRPLITDLDGDGENEVVLVTREPALRVVRLPPAERSKARDDDEWKVLEDVSEASLLSNVAISKGRQPVALASGYLEQYSADKPRMQVVVVVTEGWGIMCFDHKLKLLWERTVEVDMSNTFLNEVAVMVSSHKMRQGDFGSVIVGGRLHDRDDPRLHTLKTVEKEQAAKMEEQGVDLEAEDILGAGDAHHNMGQTHHFSFYSFEGKTGALRWKHEAADFHGEQSPTDLLHPQHEAHSGETDWRNFRQSVMNSMPHLWAFREDTNFVMAHFDKRRPGRDNDRMRIRKQKDALPHTHMTGMRAGGLQPHSQSEHIRMPNALVAHLRDGIEVVHLFSGRPVCRVSLKKGVAHIDLNGDGVLDHVEAVAGHNTPFARARRGHASKVPRCLGLVTSAVPPTHQLFNGSICATSAGGLLRPFTTTASEATDASLENEHILVANPTILPHYDERRPDDSHHVTTEVKSKHSHKIDGKHHAHTLVSKRTARRLYDSVFLVSSGVVTSYTPQGSVKWQINTPCTWDEAGEHDQGDTALAIKKLSMLPGVYPYRLWHHGKKDHVVCIGQSHMAIISNIGKKRSDTLLEGISVSSPVIGDFSNDGWNDVLVVTDHGYYGYVLERRIGTKLFTVLVGGLLIALFFTLAVQLSARATNNKGKGGVRLSASAQLRRSRHRLGGKDI